MADDLTSAEIVERLRAARGRLRAADKDCPARRTHLGDAPCPKCRATMREGCGLEISGLHRFVAEVDDAILSLTPTSGGASAPAPLSERYASAGVGHAPSSAAENGADAAQALKLAALRIEKDVRISELTDEEWQQLARACGITWGMEVEDEGCA